MASAILFHEATYSLAPVGVTGTGYHRSLLAVESDPYNF
jgi:hypothetical protein